ncbi:hypothetical protein [Pseudoneobacillus rhizosphaerae]|nr:hypothetical protein [Pseudoneobacillus rhizosphaerae]
MISLVISLAGILSKYVMPFWQTALLMIALSSSISILLNKRMSETIQSEDVVYENFNEMEGYNPSNVFKDVFLIKQEKVIASNAERLLTEDNVDNFVSEMDIASYASKNENTSLISENEVDSFVIENGNETFVSEIESNSVDLEYEFDPFNSENLLEDVALVKEVEPLELLESTSEIEELSKLYFEESDIQSLVATTIEEEKEVDEIPIELIEFEEIEHLEKPNCQTTMYSSQYLSEIEQLLIEEETGVTRTNVPGLPPNDKGIKLEKLF